jgi:hypothetical protein
MDGDLEKDIEGSGHRLIEVPSRNLTGGTEKPTKSLIRMTKIYTEIRTGHFPNTSPERYHYAKVFGVFLVICLFNKI